MAPHELDALLQGDPPALQQSDPPNLLNRVSVLEKNVFAKSFEGDALQKRIFDLEQAFPSQEGIGVGTVEQRVNALTAAVIPKPAPDPVQAQTVSKEPRLKWLTNPAPMPMLDAFGRGLKNGGRALVRTPQAAAEGTRTVLKSPLFWGTAAAAGAVVGGYFLLKKSGGGGGGTYPTEGYAGGGYPASGYSGGGGYSDDDIGNMSGFSEDIVSDPSSLNNYGATYMPSSFSGPASYGSRQGWSSSPFPGFGPSMFQPAPGFRFPGSSTNALGQGGLLGGAYHSVRSSTDKNGVYKQAHHATNRDGTTTNNWSHKGQVNPFTGKRGTRNP